eukprot:GFYU01048147.1.p1 GENE.GFYU01048147.1~~GFYU01048147.1.p1  ORF type:complete len:146 (-),score=9.74 GFYU01048147.1:68-505(-)
MEKGDYMDGLLEGHESGAVKWLNRLGLIAFAVLSGVCMILNFASVAMKGGNFSAVFVGVAILGLVVLVFLEVSWHRRDQMAKKHRYVTIYLMLMVLLLDVASCITFHTVLTYKEPSCEYVPPHNTTTVAPTTPPTTANASADWFY